MKAVLVFCAIFIIQARCGIIIESPNPDRVHNGHCYAEKGNIGEMALNERKVLPPGECYVANCEENHDVIYRGCAPFQVPGHCTIIPGDPEKSFPDCCEQPKCGKPLSVTIYKNGTVVQSTDEN